LLNQQSASDFAICATPYAICNATDPDYLEQNTNAIEFEIQYLEALLSTLA
jgi:hypothetical protein